MSQENYKHKYLKYKAKYLELSKYISHINGGGINENEIKTAIDRIVKNYKFNNDTSIDTFNNRQITQLEDYKKYLIFIKANEKQNLNMINMLKLFSHISTVLTPLISKKGYTMAELQQIDTFGNTYTASRLKQLNPLLNSTVDTIIQVLIKLDKLQTMIMTNSPPQEPPPKMGSRAFLGKNRSMRRIDL